MSLQNQEKLIITDTLYKEWCQKCKREIIATSNSNLSKRLNKILSTLTHIKSFEHFKINQQDLKQMFSDTNNAILSWKGVEVNCCKKIPKLFKEYKKLSINWFNRNKAKIYGNYFFYPLIYVHILKFCNEFKGITNNQRVNLFIVLFIEILNAKIKFIKTKNQPLLPNQSLMQPNKFKTTSYKFLNHFNMETEFDKNITPSKIKRVYQKDKKRSDKISTSFIDSLNKIKNILNLSQNQCALFLNTTQKFTNNYNQLWSTKQQNVSSTNHVNVHPIHTQKHTYSSPMPLNALQNQLIQTQPLNNFMNITNMNVPNMDVFTPFPEYNGCSQIRGINRLTCYPDNTKLSNISLPIFMPNVMNSNQLYNNNVSLNYQLVPLILFQNQNGNLLNFI